MILWDRKGRLVCLLEKLHWSIESQHNRIAVHFVWALDSMALLVAHSVSLDQEKKHSASAIASRLASSCQSGSMHMSGEADLHVESGQANAFAVCACL